MARSRNLSVAQFQQLMERIPKEVAAELEGIVTGAAEGMAAQMRQAVPLGVDGRNEALESIRVAPGKHPLRKVVRAGGDTRKRSGTGKEYDYARAIEFGRHDAPAQPFFWPVYRLTKRSWKSRIARAAKKAIAKVVPLK